MDWNLVITLAGVAVSMTWTPGPNNAMLTASGANFGWQRTLPHAMGVAFGFPLMLFLVAVGLGQVFVAYPLLADVLGWGGFLAILWFAWRIANAGAAGAADHARPLTFLEASAFQWVNPKAWAFAIWVSAGYVAQDRLILDAGIAALVFLASGLGSSQVWSLFGVGVGRILGEGVALRAFNILMALLLVASGLVVMLRG